MNNSSSCHLLSHVLYLSGYSALSVMGLIMNIIAIYLFFHVTKLRSPTIVYMKNLAIADLLLVCTTPLKIYSYTIEPSKVSLSLRFWICSVFSSFLLVNMYGSIFLLTCISFDRYLAICFPLRSQHLRQKAPWICIGVWVLNGTSYIVNLVIYIEPTGNHSCLDGRPPSVTQKVPTIGAIGIGFLVPLGVIVISSVAMLKSMNQSHVVQEGLVNRVKVIRMLATNITIFLLCFLPYHLVLLFYQFMDNCFLEEAYQFTLLIACFNTVLDPVAYYFTTDTIRNMVREEIRAGKKFLELSDHSSERNRPIISS